MVLSSSQTIRLTLTKESNRPRKARQRETHDVRRDSCDLSSLWVPFSEQIPDAELKSVRVSRRKI